MKKIFLLLSFTLMTSMVFAQSENYKSAIADFQMHYNAEKFDEIFNELYKLMEMSETKKADIVEWLKNYIPEFDHVETGLSLDKKM